VGGREECFSVLASKLLRVVLEVGLYLDKEPSKFVLIASIFIGGSDLNFTRLVNYKLELAILLFEYLNLSGKLL
jgi:hypothetical protein